MWVSFPGNVVEGQLMYFAAQIEQNTFEFHDKELERLVTLTPSDRAWMDQVVRSVEDTWNPVSRIGRQRDCIERMNCQADPTRPMGMA
jgi:hypothetical protein